MPASDITKSIDNYHSTFDPEQHYVELLYRDGKGSQGREQNDQQKILNHRIQGLASAIFKDGDIIAGAQIAVDPETGHVRATAGRIFMSGRLWDVEAAEFDVPTSGTLAVGIHIVESVISELEDPGLLNPARGQRTEGLPGAWRLKMTAAWGFEGDMAAGDFFAVYTLDDAVVRVREAPPTLDSTNLAIARYDRDSTGTGTYVVSGLTVSMGADLADGRQVYHLAEGRARIGGYGVELPTSRRILYDARPDLRTVSMEVQEAASAASTPEGQRLNVGHAPLHAVNYLRITAEETFTIVHGAYLGCADTLPVTGVVSIEEVRQQGTVYAAATDYARRVDQIDWAPAGNEPSPGSTYTARIRYMKEIEPEKADLDGFTIKGAVPGTSVVYSYDQALPRYDRLVMDAEGLTTWFKGVASESSPVIPAVPESLLEICTVYQNWRPSRGLSNDGVRVIPFNELEELRGRVSYCLQEIARNRLELDAGNRESGAKVGIFVDPLLDDSMRDQGIAQSAAIVDGELTLPIINASSSLLSADIKRAATLDYSPAILLEQLLRTKNVRVNEYMMFDPLPAEVTLTPAVDRWTEEETVWTSAITRFMGTQSGTRYRRTGYYITGSSTETVSRESAAIQYLREIYIGFELAGFGSGEILQTVIFDGVAVTPEAA